MRAFRHRTHVVEVPVHFLQLLALRVQLLQGVRRQLPRLIGRLR